MLAPCEKSLSTDLTYVTAFLNIQTECVLYRADDVVAGGYVQSAVIVAAGTCTRHHKLLLDSKLIHRPVSYTHLTLPTICSV